MRLKMLINVSCCMLFIATFLLTSCSTKQRAINDLRKFSYELRDNSTYYDVEDWKNALDRFAELREKVRKYEYSSEEYRVIGQIEGECASYMVKGAKNGLLDRISKYASELEGLLEGVFGEIGND